MVGEAIPLHQDAQATQDGRYCFLNCDIQLITTISCAPSFFCPSSIVRNREPSPVDA
jgi:hypothetical protein